MYTRDIRPFVLRVGKKEHFYFIVSREITEEKKRKEEKIHRNIILLRGFFFVWTNRDLYRRAGGRLVIL